MATNVPSITFADTGVTLPAESAILSGVQADIDTAFGGGVNPGLTTPQGQIAQSLTAIIGDKNNQIAEVVNQFNPDNATGRWQDALGRIYFMNRIAAAGTVVNATCTGAVGTIIPIGSAAQDTNGYIYYSTSSVTIPSAGYVNVNFQNSTTGAIACAIGALSIIYSSIPGWDTITNSAVGVIGRDIETRYAFEERRQESVAANAVNSVQSIRAAVWAVSGVIDVYVVDNPTNASVNYGSTNYPLVANSVVVSVVGGTSSDIAYAIWSKKSNGCNYNGNTSATVQDTIGYELPYPTYTVTWLTPTNTNAYFAVQIANNSNLSADIVTQVQNAIIAAFNGTDGGSRARIGSTIYAGRYYSGVNNISEYVEILSILMGTATGDRTHTSIAFGIDQCPILSSANISVTLV